MFLIRLGVVALVILLFLPGPPRSHVPGAGGGDGFCDRYPKTCDASVEIGNALKHKLAFGVGWIGDKAGIRLPGLGNTGEAGQGQRSNTRHYDEWSQRRPADRYNQRYNQGTLGEADRRPFWPDTSARRDVYPGR